MTQRRDKMDELFPDMEKLTRLIKRLAIIAFVFATLASILSAACGR